MRNKPREFTFTITEGDAVIHLKNDQTVSLVFAEDGDTIAREMSWPDHEVYKTAVQFALMMDSYLKNGDGLDSIILHSPTGNIAAELLGKDLLQISLAGMGNLGQLEVDNPTKDDTTEQEGDKKIPDNVLDLTEKLKKSKEDNEKE